LGRACRLQAAILNTQHTATEGRESARATVHCFAKLNISLFQGIFRIKLKGHAEKESVRKTHQGLT